MFQKNILPPILCIFAKLVTTWKTIFITLQSIGQNLNSHNQQNSKPHHLWSFVLLNLIDIGGEYIIAIVYMSELTFVWILILWHPSLFFCLYLQFSDESCYGNSNFWIQYCFHIISLWLSLIVLTRFTIPFIYFSFLSSAFVYNRDKGLESYVIFHSHYNKAFSKTFCT